MHLRRLDAATSSSRSAACLDSLWDWPAGCGVLGLAKVGECVRACGVVRTFQVYRRVVHLYYASSKKVEREAPHGVPASQHHPEVARCYEAGVSGGVGWDSFFFFAVIGLDGMALLLCCCADGTI